MARHAEMDRSLTRMGKWLKATEHEFILSCLEKEPAVHSILDVGAGSGRFAVPLQERGFQVTATEINARLLRRIKARNSQVQTVLTSQQTCNWPIKHGAVDCVLAIQVPPVHYAWFWKESRRVVKPNGTVIAGFGNRWSYKGAFADLRWRLGPVLPKGLKRERRRKWHVVSTRTVVKLLEEAGFQLCRSLGYYWLPMRKYSNSFLVPLLTNVEERLRLGNLAPLSPWVLLEARAC